MYAAYAPIYQTIGQAWIGLRALATVQAWLAAQQIVAQRVVDLGCGAGECAIQIALQGAEVLGIDQSPAMLALARQQNPTSLVEWRESSITAWTVDQPVDLVISFYDTLNYVLDDQALAEVCQAVGAALRPGGVFAFDINTPLEYSTWAERATVTADNPAYLVYNVLDLDDPTGLAQGRIVWFANTGAGWQRGEECHTQRGHSDPTIAATLASAGLQIQARLNLEGEAANPAEATRILYIAQKIIES